MRSSREERERDQDREESGGVERKEERIRHFLMSVPEITQCQKCAEG